MRISGVKKLFLLAGLCLLACIHCQPKLQSNLDRPSDDIITYRRETISKYNFHEEPLKSDINSVTTPTFQGCRVMDSSIVDPIMKSNNYYGLFYYSRPPCEGHTLVTVLGYYDLYYHLFLISLDDEKLLDWILIASISGDAGDFNYITAEFKTLNELETIQTKGRRTFTKPDSTIIELKVNSLIRIDEDGKFKKSIISSVKADSIIEKSN